MTQSTEEQLQTAIDLLACLVDKHPCDADHDTCYTHHFVSLDGETCPNAVARDFLAAYQQQDTEDDDATSDEGTQPAPQFAIIVKDKNLRQYLTAVFTTYDAAEAVGDSISNLEHEFLKADDFPQLGLHKDVFVYEPEVLLTTFNKAQDSGYLD